jgi:hypothetical protein
MKKISIKLIITLITIIIISMTFIQFMTPSVFADNSYSIMVNYQAQTVTVYNNNQAIKAFVCSTGRATPKGGTYKTTSKFRWGTLNGGVAGQYSTRIVGSILFHSVPYTKLNDPTSLEYWEYDKLGTNASAGCVRLKCGDAKWIFENCPSGTPVTFYANENPGPLGRPQAIKISDAPDNFKGWDPTDPDGNNPWGNIEDAGFNYKYYADNNSDLKEAFGYDAYKLRMHYYENGLFEGRQGSSAFSVEYYKNKYSDLKKAFGNNAYSYYIHFLRFGVEEGRNASNDFNLSIYKSNYKDLQKAFGNNSSKYIKHYANEGYSEGRIANVPIAELGLTFDAKFYSNKYSDLKKAFGTDTKKLYDHFIEFGIKEGRQASRVFDVKYYLENNSDLLKAFGNKSYKKAYNHFYEFGIKEFRKTSEQFDINIYKANYSDLQKAFKNNCKSYYTHYIEFGLKEGRITDKLIEEEKSGEI